MLGIAQDVLGLAQGVSNLIGGNKAQNKQLELMQQEQDFQHALAGLSNQQQYVLQQQLNNAKNATERYAILTNAVTQIRLQQAKKHRQRQ